MRAESESRVRVLLVERNEQLREAYTVSLERAGIEVISVPSAHAALRQLAGADADVIVADPEGREPRGVDFLSAVREHDHDLPVILLTDAPALEAAVHAVTLGAFRYLIKPVQPDDLSELVVHAARRGALVRRHLAAHSAASAADQATRDLGVRLTQAIESLWMAYQPIVATTGRFLFGYEALLRTERGGFPSPEHVIGASVRLERSQDLGRAVRAHVARDAWRLPRDAVIFVNLLPTDLLDTNLFAIDAALTHIAERVVLELTERDTLASVPDLAERVATLRSIGFRIALDDLGAGSSGLSSLTDLQPDIVKLDRSLIRGVHLSTHRQAVVRSVVALCRALRIGVIGEGVERPDEEAALRQLEVEHLQGFLIAAPTREVRRPPLVMS